MNKKSARHLKDAKNGQAAPHLPELPLAEIEKKKGFRFLDRRRLKKKPEKAYLITMLFSNGTSRTFVIASNAETFMYKKRIYYLKSDEVWFDLSHNQYHLYYFDDYAVPIDRAIQKKGDAAYFSVTSENLKPLLRMEYVKSLASSQELSKYLKLSLFLGAVNTVLSLIMILMIYYAFYK